MIISCFISIQLYFGMKGILKSYLLLKLVATSNMRLLKLMGFVGNISKDNAREMIKYEHEHDASNKLLCFI